jgi:hypothetical protein
VSIKHIDGSTSRVVKKHATQTSCSVDFVGLIFLESMVRKFEMWELSGSKGINIS